MRQSSDEGGHDMAGLDDLFTQIPVAGHCEQARCRRRRGEQRHPDAGARARRRLAAQRRSPTTSTRASSSRPSPTQAASGLLDGGVSVDQVDQKRRRPDRRPHLRRQRQQPGRVGAGRRRRWQQRSDQEAAADPRADRAGLHRQAARPRAAALGPGPAAGAAGRRRRPRRHSRQHPRRRRGGGGGGNNPLGSILGSVLGGGQGGNAIGDILGGLLGGKK